MLTGPFMPAAVLGATERTTAELALVLPLGRVGGLLHGRRGC